MKDQALWLYRRLTARSRSKLLDSLRDNGNVPIAVLFYHRVSDRHPNEWTIGCDDFARHLDWLQQNYDVVSLEEAQLRTQSKFCDRPTVAITFDDGYADNGDFAIPELARRGLTATYFVSTDFVKTGRAFPHDAKAELPLSPNTFDQLREYVDLGIEIGAHTRTHCDLGQVTIDSQIRDEIVGSVSDLEAWLGSPVRYFAFPYGLPHNTSQEAVDVIKEIGLQGFCTAYGAWNWPGSGGFHLRRIHADRGIERLRNWLTLDSRKLEDSQQLPFTEPEVDELQMTSELM